MLEKHFGYHGQLPSMSCLHIILTFNIGKYKDFFSYEGIKEYSIRIQNSDEMQKTHH